MNIIHKVGERVFFIEDFKIKEGYIKRIQYIEEYFNEEDKIHVELKYIIKTDTDYNPFMGRNMEEKYFAKSKDELIKRLQ